jgi:hypothetical protein
VTDSLTQSDYYHNNQQLEALAPDIVMAEQYLNTLDPTTDLFTFQTFDDVHIDGKKRGDKTLAKIFQGSLKQHMNELIDLQSRGAGVFVTINETDLSGRSEANITRIRAVWEDQDDIGLQQEYPLDPHLVIESSPGKFQRLWLVKDMTVDQHKRCLNTLVVNYKSDNGAKGINRVLRLPGFFHQKNEPVMVSLIECSDEPAYEASDFMISFKVGEATTPLPVSVTEPLRGLCLDDAALISRARNMKTNGNKFSLLFDQGRVFDTSTGEEKIDPSAVDQSMLELLAFVTGRDAEKMERIFSASALGYRDKWLERPDYRKRSIEKAIKQNIEKGGRSMISVALDTDFENLTSDGVPVMSANDDYEAEPKPFTLDMEPFCHELLNLPGPLGAIQDHIFGRMLYPGRAEAGFAAIATVSAIAQTHITIRSHSGLATNEYFIQASLTGFGKEDTRRAIEDLIESITYFESENNFRLGPVTKLIRKMPASEQGIHDHLQDHKSVFFLSDEFAEWLASTQENKHRQGAVGYAMELYTSATRNGVCVPNAVTNKYVPVDNPRVGIYGSTTPSRIAEAMSGSHARSGVYNRMICFVSDEGMPKKRYSGQVYEIPQEVKKALDNVADYSGEVTMSDAGFKEYVRLDELTFEELKFKDPMFAGRLMEQTIKMAACYALVENVREIEPKHFRWAAAVRLNLYKRMAALTRHECVADDLSPTGKALEQLKKYFSKNKSCKRSGLVNWSRTYKNLSVLERESVCRALLSEGIVVEGKMGRFNSLICQ